MTHERDPARMLDTVDPKSPLHGALAAGRRDLPSEQALARMAVAIGAGTGVSLAAAGAKGATAAGKIIPFKLASIAVATAIAGGGLYYVAKPEPPLVAVRPAIGPRAPDPPPVREAIPDPIPNPIPNPVPKADPPPPAPAITVRQPRKTRPLPEVTPPSEMELVERARTLLGSDPGASLAAAEAHRHAYPGGTFAQEREVIAIEALLALGRTPEAKARAARFDEAFPGSAHRARIRDLLDQKK
jgi:hypothetical protein